MIQTINPYNGQELEQFQEDNSKAIEEKLNNAQDQFEQWRLTSYKHRSQLILKVADLLRKNTDDYAIKMTREMGETHCPISQ
ncbi:succinate-semialdehyde dehydrogenase [Nonlabens ulvanivorans]|nr:succinate-semialdehyde dehydrogenase [Nonlabens ulvanivorans]